MANPTTPPTALYTLSSPAVDGHACVFLSAGEIADRLTIALLKVFRGKPTGDKQDAQMLDVAQYSAAWRDFLRQLTGTSLLAEKASTARALFVQLLELNNTLWECEDAIRALRKLSTADVTLAESAAKISTFNDERSALKSAINSLFNQTGDMKSYASDKP